MTRQVNVTQRCSPEIISKLMDPTVLLEFHGQGTEVGPWVDGCRVMRFPVDASGSPLPGMRHATALVQQRFDGSSIRNSMNICNMVKIESQWCHDGSETVTTTAKISASRIPPPLSWLVEGFVAQKARHQIRSFVQSCGCRSSRDECPRAT